MVWDWLVLKYKGWMIWLSQFFLLKALKNPENLSEENIQALHIRDRTVNFLLEEVIKNQKEILSKLDMIAKLPEMQRKIDDIKAQVLENNRRMTMSREEVKD